ncbi:MAG: hypothetical protein GW778_06355 [Alphaproteobacteria bacterium]|nr:hypothetical protein [Alphaproteobacteria bacterium]
MKNEKYQAMQKKSGLSERALTTATLHELSEMAGVGGRLTPDFWRAVENINAVGGRSKARQARVQKRQERIRGAGLLEAAQSANARCIYTNVKDVANRARKMPRRLQSAMLDNIRWLAEDYSP